MKEYRKAKSGETKCMDCEHSGIRPISKRLQCCINSNRDNWGVVAMGNTCQHAAPKVLPRPPKPEGGHKTLEQVRGERLKKWRKEYVSDWIADIAARDNGRVFMSDAPGHEIALVTYGDLRELMRQDNEINAQPERENP